MLTLMFFCLQNSLMTETIPKIIKHQQMHVFVLWHILFYVRFLPDEILEQGRDASHLLACNSMGTMYIIIVVVFVLLGIMCEIARSNTQLLWLSGYGLWQMDCCYFKVL